MAKSDVVIIGGSAGGIVAGITARRHYKDAKITLIRQEKEEHVLIPCGIPYIFGTVGATAKNIMPDTLLSNNNIDLVIDEATSIDRERKAVTTAKGDSIEYGKLVIATGSTPLVLPLPGINLENVFVANKDRDYLDGLLDKLDTIKKVVVIGCGFIGLEFADEFKKRDISVTIVEVLPHCLQLVFDEEVCTRVEKQLAERGVEVLGDSRAQTILGEKKVEGVQLADGRKLEADIVFIGVGVRPNTELAEKAGLEIGEARGIWVDEYGRTSDKNIFAVGDCAEKRSFFTKKPIGLRLASIAQHEGRVVGANLFELKRKNEGVIGVFSTAIGDLRIGVSGLTENEARTAGFDVIVKQTAAPDKHPGSMPDCTEQGVKLVFDKASGEILGGQVYGGPSVGELVNVLSAMITTRMKADQIATFQFGSHPALTASPVVYPIVNAAENVAIGL